METAVASLTARLEKLTSRLESVEKQLSQGPPAGTAAAPSAAASAGAASGDACPARVEFEALVESRITANMEVAKTHSKVVADQLKDFLECCHELAIIIQAASISAKPAAATDLQAACKKLLMELAPKVAAYKDKFNRDPQFFTIAAIAEAVAVFQWPLIAPAPVPFLSDVIPGSEFYINKVMMAAKGKDEALFKFIKDFRDFLKDLQAYVKRSHTTGLAFTGKPGAAVFTKAVADLHSGSAAAAPAPAAGGCPPPPPPPPPPPAPESLSVGKEAKSDMTSIFGELNKGTDISKGLKHVTKEMKTKNRSEEEKAKSSVVPASVPASAAAAPKTEKAVKPKKPPTTEHNGNKWMVENHVAGETINLDDTRLNDAVYIGGCTGCTVVIKGKINSMTIDGCNKVGVVCDNIVGVIEVVNSNSVQLQITGKTPCVNIDKCSGVQLFLSEAAMEEGNPTNIFTAKSSAVNIMVPAAKADEDMIEQPVPEQFKTIVSPNRKLVTEFASIGGF